MRKWKKADGQIESLEKCWRNGMAAEIQERVNAIRDQAPRDKGEITRGIKNRSKGLVEPSR